jgi:hypothetical protein
VNRPATAVRLCRNVDEFVTEAQRWEPQEPFPALPGPTLDRYAALFGAGGLPGVRAARRAGVVVSTGGVVSDAAGRLLAVATGRPHHHVPADQLLTALSQHSDELVAVMGLADELAGVGDWPGRGGTRVGVLVGRDEQSLVSLIYRSLSVDAVAAHADEKRVFVGSHPLLQGSTEADAVSLGELNYVREHRPRLLVLRGQGRECCVSLLTTMVCGRSEPLSTALPVVPGQRATPCLHGEGCFRTDLTEADLLPAAEVNATVVFTQSCSSVAVGTNAYPLSISVSLGLLEGTAVAVVGVLGVHVVHRSAQWDLEDAIADGLSLGDAVRRLGERARPLGGELARFGLLGDPGLVLASPGEPTFARTRERLSLDEVSLARLGRLNDVVSRLRSLSWLEINVPDQDLNTISDRIRAAARDPFDPEISGAAGRIEDDLADLHLRIAEGLIDKIHSPGWDPGWRSNGFQQVERDDTTCPACDRPIAVRLLLRHRVERELWLQTMQCRRCGDVWWTTEPGQRSIEMLGPVDVDGAATGSVEIRREIVNRSANPVRGAIGYAFRGRRNLGLPAGRGVAFALGPEERFDFRSPIDSMGVRLPVDTHTVTLIAMFDGFFASSMVMLQLAPRVSDPGPLPSEQ